MRRRTRASRQGHEGGNLWISFSDLMSALMLIFVLILFYAVYQYYDMLEVKTEQLDVQSKMLDERDAQLTSSLEELETKEAVLDAAQRELEANRAALDEQSRKLSESEAALDQQRAQLETQQGILSALEEKLDEQEKELAAAQTDLSQAQEQQRQQAELLARQEETLASQQATLTSQQAQMAVQQAQMEAQQAQLDKLVGVRSAIVEELIRALADSNINDASVDESGAIVFSSEMMFDVDRATLKETGKHFLNSFIPSYLEVLMSEQYRQYVSQIIIEGHTDTDGTFLKNMELSQQRAYAVLRYILSGEFNGISPEAKRQLEEIVTVNGRSYSDPIYNPDGTVDKAASRRVVIKFRMNDEEMVNQMLSILENMDG